MGWNHGYILVEQIVIGAYELNALTPALLAVVMEPFRETDLDSGDAGARSSDGLDVKEIVVKTMEPAEFSRLIQDRDARGGADPDDEDDPYWSGLDDAFNRVTARFGWPSTA